MFNMVEWRKFYVGMSHCDFYGKNLQILTVVAIKIRKLVDVDISQPNPGLRFSTTFIARCRIIYGLVKHHFRHHK